ncbi:glucosidase (plasmid) [Rhizobium sp. WSM4643]|uniref:MGH1-like glycoside hydrolase domain-containing protein n=1 Tax=Rhizobium sp. WSM4643 TaxID=3138253 RepID=UPI0021A5CEA9|nr:glucosidase [Rhizobium leguminosarum]UWM78847.1 glucosidase [Rhizobium leguminosarum bv. viciae]
MHAKPRSLLDTVEGQRLLETGGAWRRWGPFLAERQWGTVREDYSADGDAWNAFFFEHARSRAYRWGEDGIGGFCDEGMRWCLSLALWNGRDEILKERLFGLNNEQGNHGEDVKEVYHYVDATPTHSYQKMVYRYPQDAFPYDELVRVNGERSRFEREYEIGDTGVFADDRFFDVTIEYAKAAPDDILMRVTVKNAGAAAASIHLLPQVWARNTWSWKDGSERPVLERTADGDVLALRTGKKTWRWSVDREGERLFCENETNAPLLFGSAGLGPFKDGVNDYVVDGKTDAVSARGRGSKAAAHIRLEVPAAASLETRLRWRPDGVAMQPFADFNAIFRQRIEEADEFYGVLQGGIKNQDARRVQRQAIAGMLWSKQVYYFDVPTWLNGDPAQPKPPTERRSGRNADWHHLNNADVISMPDTWEYPWYAAWDLAFHCVSLALVDSAFAKNQLILFTREWFMHPNGQLPAYEWEFGDVNPPVHAWAALKVYQMDRERIGVADTDFLKRIFHKLMLNFTWWVNRKDNDGRNIFQGGFLGLDNISPFNRSEVLPEGASIDQADGTAWMAMYALNLMRIALELAMTDPVYEDMATKFFEHFLSIAGAMADVAGSGQGLWNEADDFFYDVLHNGDGRIEPIPARSMIGLIPIFAVEVLDQAVFDKLPEFSKRLHWFLKHRPQLANLVPRWTEPGAGERSLLSLLHGDRLKKLLRRMLDEQEFLSEFGVRSMSKVHLEEPCSLNFAGMQVDAGYTPGEAQTGLFGGNSNWRGPIWMPVNFLLIDSLRKFHAYFGDDYRVECPVGSGVMFNLEEVAHELSRRLQSLFLKDENGRRPSVKSVSSVDDHVLFHEYFHGDTGEGLGASHQTGWTGLIANLLDDGG